ncbi:hypothetical protein [Isoptericola sp. NPDC056134]|uniref:hypothetical protein n=1 Tax=Isoptericola sp. NPDC056134 TaxID=3345723 RepID=UPI0035E7B6E3
MSLPPPKDRGLIPPPGERRRFRRALASQAKGLGQRIASGEDAGITQQETTITETVLLNLHGSLGDRLSIKPLTQRDEGRRGADWVWCVGGPHGWFSFYVQAKKLKEGGYDFGFKSGDGGRQIERLIATASRARVQPVYVLYNPTRPRARYSLRRCAGQSGSDSFTFVSAFAAFALLGERNSPRVSVARVARHAHPWACLAGCPRDRRAGTRRDMNWPPDIPPLTDLPPGVDVATDLSELLLSQTADAAIETENEETFDGMTRVARDTAASAYSSEPPLWVTNPADALGMWHEGQAIDDRIPEPSVIVTQQFVA